MPDTRRPALLVDTLRLHTEIQDETTLKIGVISDTHGLMRPEALNALRDSDLILHAGDVGSPAILEALRTIAPVVAVRGNNDSGTWAERIEATEVVQAGAHYFYLLHNIKELNVDPVAAGFRVVVSGHSHRPKQEEQDGILYFNPGSAGPRRFKLPVAVGRLRLTSNRIQVEIVELSV